jgi:cobalt-zinc-cadmium efflux system membrane fusion protein
MTTRSRSLWIAVALGALLAAGCDRRAATDHDGGPQAHDDHGGHGHGDEGPRGAHGGRVFEAPGVKLELAIDEAEGPPVFKAWIHDAEGKDVRLERERLTVVLERFGGRRDTVTFRIDGDHFHGVQVVGEPHSFRAAVALEHEGTRHAWSYEQVESRVELAPEAVEAAGIESGVALPSPIEVAIEAPGEVRLDAERVVQVRPRFPGVVREMRKRLGERVAPGEVLSVVHSNESLSNYDIAAAMGGTVVSQDAAVGQAVDRETMLYTVADLSRVWVDFPIYPQAAGRIRVGQTVRVSSESGPPLSGAGAVRYVGPLLEQDTRVSYGRVVLDNGDRRWQPGLYVTARVVVERVQVPVAVPEEAIVRMSFGPAVFRADGPRFEMQPVVPGRSDGRLTEIVEGLEPGARIVVRNAFLLKAELGKSEARHEH